MVTHLLEKPFSRHLRADKKETVKQGCPRPQNFSITSQAKGFIQHFQNSIYSKHPWITACAQRQKLFCWPSLLFCTVKEKNVWTTTGHLDLNNLFKAMQRHERSLVHMQTVVQQISKHNAQVEKKRDVLKRFIDIVCLLGRQELSFRTHDESATSLNRGNYVEMAHFLIRYDDRLVTHFSTASNVFTGLSNHIQNDIVQSVSTVILNFIKKELLAAPFVAIMVDETSDFSLHSQASVVFRYVDEDGKAQEWFVGFKDVSADRSVKALADMVFEYLEVFQCGNKLVAETYDGAAGMSGEVSGLQTRVRERYPKPLFVHCYTHVLNLVLSQSIFSFFSHSTKQTQELDKVVRKRLPSVAPTRWNFSSRLVNTVEEHHKDLLELFGGIVENPEGWDHLTIGQSQGYLQIPSNFKFNFLLVVFSEIFHFTDVLYDILQTKAMDITLCIQEVQQMKNNIAAKRDDFNTVWSRVENLEDVVEPLHKGWRCDAGLPRKDHYRRLCLQIIDHVVGQMNAMDHLGFLSLMDGDAIPTYTRKFPQEAFNCLINSYGEHFNAVRLKNKLITFYARDEFPRRNVAEIMLCLKKHHLYIAFFELYKLYGLILIITAATASVWNTLKRIKTYSRSTTGQQQLSGLFFSIEKGIMQKLQEKGSEFYDAVISEFTKKTHRLDFQFSKK
uniref:DUF4371 domain-containing protein n=1 Tax=Latimeria chalumnae TaxID=7897 RepID=H3B203_LATCH